MIVALPDSLATEKLGQALAQTLQPGMQVHLHGDLGAGKTTLIRALLRGLGVSGRIKSPTYTLVEPYEIARLPLHPQPQAQNQVELHPLSKIYLYHFDFYRFSDPREWLDAGFAEYFRADSVCFIEWPEKAANTLPQHDLSVSLNHASSAEYADFRTATLQAYSERGQGCLNHLHFQTAI
ncbi:tRNA (adenosine(37)-N6)-threonylcarbamoyltransferase complex ATPase subunit type 1 TsaE [Parvibium lacunae]|uniref:tRNA threonylcarbamoyladenosine biosynthesis protein TsaE n=1 Tax=Parvibium lacunae TaxID=1888893 RepID=A0A368L1D5_9BURK|nr:tRNA (adenosine(37)-N6)-threonylcarbamoyltransferase complex ATPase subunit type 1 TsaE [Parvibium lacunae]RCS57342.1 tRNA (adenosine(37)-N6)-threonylcarbamoyltransferase complex ATPase subunit type 1 TsaE [Parvibium lacunae]